MRDDELADKKVNTEHQHYTGPQKGSIATFCSSITAFLLFKSVPKTHLINQAQPWTALPSPPAAVSNSSIVFTLDLSATAGLLTSIYQINK